MIKKIFKRKQGKLQKIFIMFIILFIAFMTNAVMGVDSQEDVNEEGENGSEELGDLCFEVDCGISEGGDDEVVEDVPLKDSEDEIFEEEVNNSEDDGGVEEDVEHGVDVVVNETNQADESKSTDGNQTGESGEIINLEPVLNLEISDLNKVIRGEIFEARAVVTVSEARANNVSFSWVFPEDFKIVFGDVFEKCGGLDVGESCESIIGLEVLDFASLRKDEIKVRVSYEN